MKTRLLILIALAAALTGCEKYRLQNYISDQNKKYVAARAVPPLKIPSNLNNASLSDQQVIIPTLPADNDATVTHEPSLLPPGSMTAQIQAGTLPTSVLKTKLPDPE